MGRGRRRDCISFCPFCLTLKRKNIMAKGKQIKVKATARRKPKLSSGKGGFLVGRVSTVIKNKKSRNG